VFKRSDDSLIRQALEGDERAWQQLVSRYQSMLYHYSFRLTGNADDARDLLQDVLLVLCRNLAQYRGDSSFKTWLFGIANYRAMDMLRKRKPTQDVDDCSEQLVDDRQSHEQHLDSLQRQRDVRQQLTLLPAEQRLVVELRFYQQFTVTPPSPDFMQL
jgi:RNA polymerase sigma-70 factor (ECF subfamily)